MAHNPISIIIPVIGVWGAMEPDRYAGDWIRRSAAYIRGVYKDGSGYEEYYLNYADRYLQKSNWKTYGYAEILPFLRRDLSRYADSGER